MAQKQLLDIQEIRGAACIIFAAEKRILEYAITMGLPISFVSIYATETGGPRVRLGAYRHRLFKTGDGDGHRILSQTTIDLGPGVFEVIDEAAAAYKLKRA